MRIVEFRVDIEPKAQPRVKARWTGSFVQVYTPGGMKEYKAAVAEAAQAALVVTPVPQDILQNAIARIYVEFILKRSAAWLSSKYPAAKFPHTIKPDCDNLIKAVKDALNGITWADDSQVYAETSVKYFAPVEFGGARGKKRLSGPGSVYVRIQYENEEGQEA